MFKLEKVRKDNIPAESLKTRFKLFFKRRLTDNIFFKNSLVIGLLSANLILNLINWTILAIFISKIDVGIILHYNVYFGVDSIGAWKNVFIMPLIGLFIIILNGFIAAFLFRNNERIASHVLLLASVMAQISLIISSTSLIIINY